MARNGREQLAGVDRLGDVLVHAGLQATLAVALQGVGRHGDDRQVAAAAAARVREWPPSPPGRPSRASARPSAPRRRLGSRRRPGPRGRCRRRTTAWPLPLQQGNGQLLVDDAVFGQQDPQRRQRRRRGPRAGAMRLALRQHHPQGQQDGVEKFRLLDRLEQVGGDPQLFAAAACRRAGRRRSAS